MNRKQYSLMLVLALAAGLVGGVVSSQFLMSQPALAEKRAESKRIIEAEGMVIRDSNGIVRLELGVFKGLGEAGLRIYFENGKSKAITLDSFGEMGRLTFWDKDSGYARVVLGHRYGGGSELYLADKSGSPRAILGCTDLTNTVTGELRKGPPSSLALFADYGKVIWQAP